MDLDNVVIDLVQRNRGITAERLNEIIAAKVKKSLDHWRAQGRIVTKGGVKGYPFEYSTPTMTRRFF